MMRIFFIFGVTFIFAANIFAQNKSTDASVYSASEQIQMTDRLVWLIKTDQIDGMVAMTEDASRYTNEDFKSAARKAAKFVPEFSKLYWSSFEEVDEANGVHKVFLVFKGTNNECNYMMEVHYPLRGHTQIKHIEFHDAGTFNQACAKIKR